MHVHPFWSVVLIHSTLESNSLPGFIFLCSHQWFWSTQTLKWTHSLDVFIHSCQWFWSTQTLESDSHTGHLHILISGSDLFKHWRVTYSLDAHHSSVILNCLNTGEQLTYWTFAHSCQWFWSAQTLESDSLSVYAVYSPILVSGSDLIKHWRATHFLDLCSPILIGGSDPITQWRATHYLDVCLHNLISGSDPIKQWRVTHSLDACLPILVSVSDLIKHSEQLTPWICVHHFSSVVLICSNAQ